MEEIAKAPLNQAHLLESKADSLSKKNLYDKAIACREQAIKCLEEVRSLPLTDHSISSIDLQISSHKSKIEALREQQRKKESRMPSVPRHPEAPLIHISPEKSLAKLGRKASLEPPRALHNPTQTDIELAIRNEILKGDKLLESLVSQQSPLDTPPSVDEAAVGQQLMISSAIKLPKPVEQVLEELQLHNLQLKSLIGILFEELEGFKVENKGLKDKVHELEREQERVDSGPLKVAEVPVPVKKDSGIDLPPLEPFEMPQIPVSIKPRVKISPRKSRVSE